MMLFDKETEGKAQKRGSLYYNKKDIIISKNINYGNYSGQKIRK